jgi:DNA-binding MarR family transcriptional regulator
VHLTRLDALHDLVAQVERAQLDEQREREEMPFAPRLITGIIDRLVVRHLVSRERSTVDRRGVTLVLSEAGRALVDAAPSPLQERFVEQLAELSAEEREIIRLTLNKIVRLMGGDALDAAPLLTHEHVLAAPIERAGDPSSPPADTKKSSS